MPNRHKVAPQGSILSTTLFVISINDIVKDLLTPIKNLLFTDDVTLYIKENNIATMTTMVQKALKNIENWWHKTGFTFSIQKNKCIIFSKKQPPDTQTPTLFNTNLAYVNEIKYLGMIVDSKLT
ncbi:hypothetical protein TcasGA2_TC030941 [Tribolium castaneum]|uniref:Reverse transcriptase domain-containing protein n=1 Tax=Tribolium castaneum TaxID=7070 RepID=A0A139WA77_TRICA|nr:hypothetical protein TcasGA2_TC030941 [Tribolium castaneum]